MFAAVLQWFLLFKRLAGTQKINKTALNAVSFEHCINRNMTENQQNRFERSIFCALHKPQYDRKSTKNVFSLRFCSGFCFSSFWLELMHFRLGLQIHSKNCPKMFSGALSGPPRRPGEHTCTPRSRCCSRGLKELSTSWW